MKKTESVLKIYKVILYVLLLTGISLTTKKITS